MKTYRTPLLAAAVWLAASILPASAAPPAGPNDSVERSVSTAGLDLSRRADQAVLRHRTAVAAHKLCEQTTHGNSIADPGYAACFATAMRDARRAIETRIAAARAGSQMASGGSPK